MSTDRAQKSRLRDLPSVDELLRTKAGQAAIRDAGSSAATSYARETIDQLRSGILIGDVGDDVELNDRAARMLARRHSEDRLAGVRRVINATGVIIHTNLGRAPLAEAAKKAINEAAGYATIEYDIHAGERGRRGARAERLAAELTGAEDALVVNNCAAAAFLVLTVFAGGGEVVISRGELVEIGGDFRVPDVLAASGAALREVGTTNRTKLADYERAIGPSTRMLLRVHPSNYRVVGFTAAVPRRDLARLAADRDLIFFEDAGSGALTDLSGEGLSDEPVIGDVIADGAHLVSFSGDKLLGGPQSGIIVGRKSMIGQLKKHPLLRTLRVDKITYAALEATLEIYRRGTEFTEIPALRRIAMRPEEIRSRVEAIMARLPSSLTAEMVDGSSVIGGGSAPDIHPPTSLLSLRLAGRSAEELEAELRRYETPIVARILNDAVVIDLRTVEPTEDETILSAVTKIAA